jgi:phosphomannomutase
VPEISRFFGVLIRMYYDEHMPPHFHAIYGGAEAQIGIAPIMLLRGSLPRRALSMVIEWAAIHQRDLQENWERMRKDQAPCKIVPLE